MKKFVSLLVLACIMLLASNKGFAQAACITINSTTFQVVSSSGTNCTKKIVVNYTRNSGGNKWLIIRYRCGTTGTFTQIACLDVSGANGTSGVAVSGDFTCPCSQSVFAELVATTGNNCGGSECFNSGEFIVPPPVGNPLPINLSSFDGTNQAKAITLNWVAESEKSFKGYQIERSVNGKDFAEQTFIQSQSNGANISGAVLKYSWTDAQPANGTNYYRLKMIDIDGTYEYSKVVIVKHEGLTGDVNIYPNPSKGTISITGLESDINGAVYSIFDMTGKLVTQNTVPSNGNISLGNMQNGYYIIHVENASTSLNNRSMVLLNK
jgi:hypothetical protein